MSERGERARVGLAVGVLAALAVMPLLSDGSAAARTGERAARGGLVVAGAARESITPFTLVPGSTKAVGISNRRASNPDGLPGRLWDRLEPQPGLTSSGQVTPSGIWGESYTDTNGNHRYDAGEPFDDDPANTYLDRDSAETYDGVYLGGFGNDRIPRGALDPIWARALYLRDGGRSVALAYVDLIGWFGDRNDDIAALAKRLDPKLDLDTLIVGSTHDHEAPDGVGLWGRDQTEDGKYPKYLRYVELKVAQAVARAARRARPARFRSAEIGPGRRFQTVRGNAETLRGLQSRNSCRTPWVLDDHVRVWQVARASGDKGSGPIATLVNWGTHVESLEGDNQYLSSDFMHTIRATVERTLGGVAVYAPGAQGAAEVVGDSCTRRWRRERFDGESFPVDEAGEPRALRSRQGVLIDNAEARDRTYAIGRVVGSAAVAAIKGARWERPRRLRLVERDLYVPVNNGGLIALSAAGVIDKRTHAGNAGRGDPVTIEASASEAIPDQLGGSATLPSGLDAKTTVYAWRVGRSTFLTAPGELFPELYFGLPGHNRARAGSRARHFDYVRPNPRALSCSARPFSYGEPRGADTKRPFEPGIREAQRRWSPNARVAFLLGYAPDLFGYIVPGYDYSWYVARPAEGVGLGAIIGEAPDPCAEHPPDLAFPEATYDSHYQETNSAGSMLAPAYACTVWEMLGLKIKPSREEAAACREWHAWKNGIVAHAGVDAEPFDPTDERSLVGHR